MVSDPVQRTQNSWRAMHLRCSNPSFGSYVRYGARGIRVCERWATFSLFVADMGWRPLGTTLDRHPDQSGDYEPGNCRWATETQQHRNCRNNRMITAFGVTKCLAEWSESTGVYRELIAIRLRRGWPPERAVSPVNVKPGTL